MSRTIEAIEAYCQAVEKAYREFLRAKEKALVDFERTIYHLEA